MQSFKHILNLPTPSKIKYFWNYGSLLGLVLGVQVVTGIFLCFEYTALASYSFLSVDLLVREVNKGDLIRNIHANGASIFFLFLYLHTGRGIYFRSYCHKFHVWQVGLTLLVLAMAIAFLGYVLPWGQMSYWGATVITNLASVIPIIGSQVVEWIWGGFSVNSATLTRFLGMHIVLPLVMVFLVGVHILVLHKTGSSNPIGVNRRYKTFHPYWTYKDLLGIGAWITVWVVIVFLFPFIFMDRENFIEANFMVTPVHIQPEWYFLPAYAVLRSIPNKLGGVIGLIMVYFIFYIKPFFPIVHQRKLVFWVWVSCRIGLMWIGSCVVEHPFIIIGQIFTLFYFILVLFI